MKKTFHLIAAFIVCNCFTAWSQALVAPQPQLGNWYIAPKYVDIPFTYSSNAPVVHPIPNFAAGTVAQNPATATMVARVGPLESGVGH